MDFKLFVAVFCLASIQVSEAAVTWTAATAAVTIQDCYPSGTIIAHAKTASTDVSSGTVTFTLGSQTPSSTTTKFAVGTAGALTTVTTATSLLSAGSYTVVITGTDTAPSTADLTVTVTVTSCCSSASFVFPSLAVMLISLISLLMKNNN